MATYQPISEKYAIHRYPGALRLIDQAPLIRAKRGRSSATRGTVQAYSHRSRQRFIRTLAAVQPAADTAVYLVTLTYAHVDASRTQPKADIKRFLQNDSIASRWHSAIWRVEQQRRGAIHFHLVCFSSQIVSDAEDRIRRAWLRASRQTDILAAHDHCTHVMECDSYSVAIARYVAGHASKAQQAVTGMTGRHWGIVGREKILVAPDIATLTPRQYHRLQRIFRNWRHSKGFRKTQRLQWHYLDRSITDRVLRLIGTY